MKLLGGSTYDTAFSLTSELAALALRVAPGSCASRKGDDVRLDLALRGRVWLSLACTKAIVRGTMVYMLFNTKMFIS
jgi:hypothetical protein